MNSIFLYLFSKKSMIAIAGISVMVFVASCYNRYVYIDDAWFGEHAYWFAKDGIARAVSIKDYFGWDQHLLVYNKFITIIGAILIKLFGWSATPLRMFTLIILLIFLVFFLQYFRNKKESFNKDEWMIAIFFVLINPLIVLYGFTFRPEILVMTLGFVSYVLLDNYLTKEKKLSFVAIAGLLSGLAFFTHPNGLIFGMAGAVLLLWFRVYKAMFVFAIFTSVTASLYFYDLWPEGRFNAFLFQMANWPVSHGASYFSNGVGEFFRAVFSKLADEHTRFFWSHKVWGISSLFIISLILNFRFIKKHHKQLLVYLFSLILFLNLFGSQIAERFLLLFLPYMIIIIAVAISRLKTQKKVFLKGLIVVLFAINIIGLAIVFADTFSRNKNFVEEHERIMSKIPDVDAQVLVNYAFIFNELENRNLVSYKTFEYHQVRINRKLSQQEFFAKSDSLQIGYIVVPPDMTAGNDNRFAFLCDGVIDENPLYAVWYEDSDYLILKRK